MLTFDRKVRNKSLTKRSLGLILVAVHLSLSLEEAQEMAQVCRFQVVRSSVIIPISMLIRLIYFIAMRKERASKVEAGS